MMGLWASVGLKKLLSAAQNIFSTILTLALLDSRLKDLEGIQQAIG
jgi:hypothetical protein